MTVRIIAPARKELRDAIAWYRERDPRVASRFAQNVRNVLQLIETHPHLGGVVPAVADTTIRQLPVHRFPYHVVFLRHHGVAEVIAFAHDRREPGYFIDRISR